ncbi:MAG TPA: ribonuclease HIII [Planctomycetota bacterium]|jgi:ribonuclease HIII|nr:ribonuclease HIII [Planctomycetota bacterium]
MAGLNTQVVTIDREAAKRLRLTLEEAGYSFYEVDYAQFGAKGEGVNVVVYDSGKMVIQGKGASDFKLMRLSEVLPQPKARLKERTIGCDEAGKGDYFGPLCVAAVALSPEEEIFLDEVPLFDSKTLTDRDVIRAAEHLRGVLPHEVISIGPKRYNEMYATFGNLNTLLAWAHAKAMLAVFDKTGCRNVLLDQFASPTIVLKALGARRNDVKLVTRVRAESDPAVAAASILARDGFLRGLARLTPVAGMPLPKGAGSPVLRAGRALVKERGTAILSEVAKVHFKTTQQIS